MLFANVYRDTKEIYVNQVPIISSLKYSAKFDFAMVVTLIVEAGNYYLNIYLAKGKCVRQYSEIKLFWVI